MVSAPDHTLQVRADNCVVRRGYQGRQHGPSVVGLLALDAEAKLPRDGRCKRDLFPGEFVSGPIVGHEFADESAMGDERHETERANAFFAHDSL